MERLPSCERFDKPSILEREVLLKIPRSPPIEERLDRPFKFGIAVLLMVKLEPTVVNSESPSRFVISVGMKGVMLMLPVTAV